MADSRILHFDIAVASSGGAVSILQIPAADQASATHEAERRGYRVLSCDMRSNRLTIRRNQRSPRVRIDVALFSHELASLLDAGLGIIDAIETLSDKERSTETGNMFRRLVQALKEGKKVSAAMAEMPQAFPPLLVANIASSEETGDMAEALRRYAANFETLRGLRSKALSAAVYPLVLLGVGALVVLFLLGFVVPKFAKLIESSHSEIPFASKLLIDLGNEINAHPEIAIALTLALAIGVALGIRHGANVRWNFSFVQQLPLVGTLVRMFRHAQFYRTSAMLIEGGISEVRAFEMAGSLLAKKDHRLLMQAVAAIREGSAIGEALAHAGLADAVTLRMLTVAERTGQLADILGRIASFQEITLARAIEAATRLFEPALMLMIGLIIGAIVVLMYLPIFDLASSIQ